VKLSIAAAHEVSVAAGPQQQSRIGAPDPALTPNAGLAVITGPVRAAQLARQDFLTGLDRQRADAAGQQIPPELPHDVFPLASPPGQPGRAGRHPAGGGGLSYGCLDTYHRAG
jgi:hypothetical protein